MKKKIVHGSTFSGIGAPEIAADMLGWGNAFHCEINPFGRSILDFYYPESKSYEDITKTDFSEWRGKIDVLTGGFPCQPFSSAGKRKGSEDDRYLWPFMLKCIEQIRPTWFVGENVAGIGTMVFPGEEVKVGSNADIFEPGDIYRKEERFVLHEIIKNLESIGYSVQPFIIPACAVGAPHRRDRVFIIARCNDVGYTYGVSNEWTEQEMAERVINTDRICKQDSERGNNATNSANVGYGKRDESGSQQGISRKVDEKKGDCSKRNISVAADGSGRIIADTEHNGLQHTIHAGTNSAEDGTPCKRGKNGETVMPESASANGIRGVVTDTACGECGTSGEGGETERIRRENDVKSEARGNTPERINGLSSLCRDFSRTESMLPHNRWRAFPSISAVHRRNDGIPFDVDGLSIPFGKWRTESLKAYGNAIVVQVMYEIFRCIDAIENGND